MSFNEDYYIDRQIGSNPKGCLWFVLACLLFWIALIYFTI